MPENQHIKNALDYYLAGNRPTHHALMLSGVWGSGKTHFIKKYIKDINSKCFYISLYGLQTLEELQKQLFIAFYPKGGKATGALANNIEAVSVNLAFLSFSLKPKNIGKNLAKTVSNLKEYNLVFDDLERCFIPIESLFGFINQLVEHNQQKVILIANEEKIPANNYAAIKEKLVGTSLELSSSPESVLEHFIEEVENGKAKECAEYNKQDILHILKAVNIPNYRSLRMAFYDFSRLLALIADIFPPFMEDTENAQEARCQLLFLVLIMELQYRRHSNDDANLEEILNYTHLKDASKDKKDKQKENIKKINDYLDPLFQDEIAYDYSYGVKPTSAQSILPFALVALFLLKGQFDSEWAQQHLKGHFLFAHRFEQPIWARLRPSKTFYNQEEFEELLQEIEYALRDKKIVDFDIILLLAAQFIAMQKIEKFCPDFLKSDIAAYFIRYIDDLAKKEILTLTNAEDSIRYNSVRGGQLPVEGNDVEFKKIIEHYHQHEEQWNSKLYKQKAQKLKSLLEKQASYHEIKNWLRDNEQQPFFQYLDSASIVELFFKPKNKATLSYPVIYYSLQKRYQQIQENAKLEPERAWFNELKTKLEERAKTRPSPYKERAEESLKKYFKKEQ